MDNNQIWQIIALEDDHYLSEQKLNLELKSALLTEFLQHLHIEFQHYGLEIQQFHV
ncbi:hypothetical protein KTJ16_14915 [Acinetobacter bereziniae]|uniref:Uncharacterized protein n=1 Tax=Acinetobacter bereziniae TaxID=106648 RepID=A0A8I1ALX4_ACIBZ|nr:MULTISPECIES: hypothetical protein [Acinetobacter]MEC8123662.1 hypothetical protein [Pseudomonadota bacterium]MBJ8423336.1 hypothetical protein [Acinetobacter bereziniae]MBJ8428405.1 hypothetical protein [Acinetobacter bereziniae]MBJ8476970.1 hypothetical protein [Acinetobacter bereziniae]MBJ9947739.1 hypothetical protein [Acinetobacter bereziniae]